MASRPSQSAKRNAPKTRSTARSNASRLTVCCLKPTHHISPVTCGRGKRNEPAYVKEVAKHAAKVRNVDLEMVAAKTVENTMALFRLSV